MRKFIHFTITCDARRQIPKMILERLVEEYLWQEQEYLQGTVSVKQRAMRVRQLIEEEIVKRNVQEEFDLLLSRKNAETN